MGTKKPKKHKDLQDVEAIKSDVASYASSIGLSSTTTSSSFSGFDDSDFRKKGPLKPRNETKHNPNPSSRQNHHDNKITNPKNNPQQTKPKPKSVTQSGSNSYTHFSNDNPSSKIFDNKFKNLPELPLVRANTLGTWYVDVSELEEKVLGSEAKKKLEIKNLHEWKSLVEKKKELGERLLAQYAREYESSRGQSGDIKMLIATQRSGTAADKVSAFSVMVGDNTVANIRSLDVLLGKFCFFC